MVSILFLLGITVVPREIEDNSYVFLKKKRGVGGGGEGKGRRKRGVLWAM